MMAELIDYMNLVEKIERLQELTDKNKWRLAIKRDRTYKPVDGKRNRDNRHWIVRINRDYATRTTWPYKNSYSIFATGDTLEEAVNAMVDKILAW